MVLVWNLSESVQVIQIQHSAREHVQNCDGLIVHGRMLTLSL